jgi:hypothetical protein
MSGTLAAASAASISEGDTQIVIEIATQNQGPEVLDLLRFPSPPLIPVATTHLVKRMAGGRTSTFRTRKIDDVVSRLAGQAANRIILERRLDPWPLPIPGVLCTRVWASLTLHPTYTAWSWTDQWPQPVAIRNFGDEASFRYEETGLVRRYPEWRFPNSLLLLFALSMQGPVHAEILIDWLWMHLDSLDPRVVSLRPFGGAYDERTRQGLGWANRGYLLGHPGIEKVFQDMTTRLLRVMSITISRPKTLRAAHRDLGPATEYKEIGGDGDVEPVGLLRIPLEVLEPFHEAPPAQDWFLRESVSPAQIERIRERKELREAIRGGLGGWRVVELRRGPEPW